MRMREEQEEEEVAFYDKRLPVFNVCAKFGATPIPDYYFNQSLSQSV